jgi:hypothetical protein
MSYTDGLSPELTGAARERSIGLSATLTIVRATVRPTRVAAAARVHFVIPYCFVVVCL